MREGTREAGLALAALVGTLLAGCALPSSLPLPLPPTASCATSRGAAASAATGGVFVAADAYDAYAAGGTSALYALRPGDGAPMWSSTSNTRGGFEGAPLLANGVVYAVAGTIPSFRVPPRTMTHGLFALRAGDGAAVWSFAFDAGSSAPPVLADGTLYLAADSYSGFLASAPPGPNPPPTPATTPRVDGDLYAVRAADGSPLWHTRLPDGAAGLVVAGRTVLTSTSPLLDPARSPPALVALRATDGATLWRARLPAIPIWPALVDGSVVYCATTTAVVALRLPDGSVLWQRALPQGLSGGGPLLGPGVVIVGTGQGAAALSTADGSVRWKVDTGMGAAAASVADGVIYLDLASADGTSGSLEAVDATSGALRWQVALDGTLDGPPSVRDGVVYVASSSQVRGHTWVAAFDERSGEVRWRYENGDSLGALAPDPGGTLYLASLDANDMTPAGQWSYVSALRAADGTLAWRERIPHANVNLSAPTVG